MNSVHTDHLKKTVWDKFLFEGISNINLKSVFCRYKSKVQKKTAHKSSDFIFCHF